MKIRNLIYRINSAALVLAVMGTMFSCGQRQEDADLASMEAVDSLEVAHPLGFCPDSLRVVEGEIRNGQFFSTLMTGLGMTQQQAYDLTIACDSVFDVKTLRVGQSYRAYYEDDSSLQYLVYDRDKA